MATTESGLHPRVEAVEDVLLSGDADRISDLYASDGQLLPPGSDFVTGRADIVDYWQAFGEAGVAALGIETLEVEDYGDTASRVGRATLTDADGGVLDEMKFIELWKREDGEWRISRDIFNSNLSDE